jgi:carboxyl-terminal processing protease
MLRTCYVDGWRESPHARLFETRACGIEGVSVVEEPVSSKTKGRNDKLVRILLSLAAVIFVVIVGVAAFAIGRETKGTKTEAAVATTAQTTGPYNYDVLNQIRSLLGQYYVRPENLDDQSLFEGAVNGMLDVLSDSGTYYVSPDVHQRSTLLTGAFEGIGATISTENNEIVIVAPIKDTPADRAGLVSGDVILAVDGESMTGWTTDQAVLRIRGEKGTPVVLTIRHTDGTQEDVTLIRDTVLVDSVYLDPPGGVLRDANGNEVTNIGYLWIQSFSGRTAEELKAALTKLLDQGAKGLIIDLRNNGGGLVSSTLASIDYFLDSGTIFIERDSAGNETTHAATPGVLVPKDIPIVILQNRFTASAAEITTAALTQNGRATSIGETSFGKGTVNLSRDLSDGGALYVTIREWLTPDRTLINKVGIRPDIEVTPTDAQIDAGEDPVLQRGIDVLEGQISP